VSTVEGRTIECRAGVQLQKGKQPRLKNLRRRSEAQSKRRKEGGEGRREGRGGLANAKRHVGHAGDAQAQVGGGCHRTTAEERGKHGTRVLKQKRGGEAHPQIAISKKLAAGQVLASKCCILRGGLVGWRGR